MGRALTPWNIHVKKTFASLKRKNPKPSSLRRCDTPLKIQGTGGNQRVKSRDLS